MKGLSRIYIGVLSFGLFGCVSTPKEKFDRNDLMLTEPFRQIDTVIYMSPKRFVDTIVFFSSKVDTVRYRDFEQGFYDQYVLNVSYRLTEGSYHRFVVVDKYSALEKFYSCSISNIKDRELSFLGLIFDKGILDKVQIEKSIVLFSVDQTIYKDVNINKGISSLKFSSKVGVISYIDTAGEEWVRIAQSH